MRISDEQRKRNKTTSTLIPGDTVASGEVVLSVVRPLRLSGGSPKGTVRLVNPSNGRIRTTYWNWYGTIIMYRPKPTTK